MSQYSFSIDSQSFLDTFKTYWNFLDTFKSQSLSPHSHVISCLLRLGKIKGEQKKTKKFWFISMLKSSILGSKMGHFLDAYASQGSTLSLTESLTESLTDKDGNHISVSKSLSLDVRHISVISLAYPRHISGISQRYLRDILGILRNISSISHTYFRHISGISWVYLRLSQGYLSHVSAISQAYLRDILGIYQAYLRGISGIS